MRTTPSRRLRALTAVGALGALVAAGLTMPIAAQAAPALVDDPASYVNTLSGTGSGGGTVGSINNFPGPATPFGMVQFSPDNPGTGQGYAYGNSTLRGFGMNHASQGCGAFGDIPILPTTASVAASASPWNATNTYTHTGEVGDAGYYALTSKDAAGTSITSELTATTRVGLADFEFPAGTTAPKVLVHADVNNQGSTTGSISIDPTTGVVTGSSSSGGFCGKNNSYTVYFAMRVDQQFSGYGAWNAGTATVTAGDGTHAASVSKAKAGGYLAFPDGTTSVHAAIAISYVSAANALLNLTTEVPTVDAAAFDAVRQATYDQWNDYLGRVQVSESDADDLTTFYDSLYRSLLHPNTFDDVNGEYIGFETDPVVHTVGESTGAHPHASQQTQYANYSDWDTYRSLAPLLAMLFPKIASDQAQSLVNDAVQSGSYPRWAFANASTNQMTGDNAVAFIAQVFAFGARDFDTATALDYMVKGASASEYTGGTNNKAIERPGADIYNELHYAPQTKQFQADHAVAGASITQEFSIDDFGIGRVAAALGEDKIATEFQQRSNYWQNLFNASTRFVSPRDITGAFPAGDGLDIPTDFGYRGNTDGFGEVGYDEGNAEQYLWLEPQNVAGLVAALGGREEVAQRLDAFMTHGMNVGPGPDQPYMWAGNEPDFGVPWLYNYIGQPWRTQEVVDEIRTTLFGPGADDSEPGNDDLGAQSSWYVWAALGIYPATPGTDVLTVNTPAFDRSVLHLGNGSTLAIDADGAQDGQRYIAGLGYAAPDAASVDLDQTHLPTGVLADGGTLTFTTAVHPDVTWATGADAAPPSWSEGSLDIVANATPATTPLAPGGSAYLQLSVQRIASTAKTGTVAAQDAPDGIQVDASAALRFDVTGRATATVPVSVDASVPAGYYPVDLAITAGADVAHAVATVRVTTPGSASDAATIVGTSPESAASGDFDGAGNSYSRDQLALLGLTPGSVTPLANGTSLVWPAAPVGRPDTIASNGQTITLERPATTISFVGAGINSGGQNTATVTYADGTTGTADYSFGDWVLPSSTGSKEDGTLAPVYGNTTVGWTPVRNASSSDPGAYIFATKPFTAPEGERIVSVRIPTTNKARLFAIAQDAPSLVLSATSVAAGGTVDYTGAGFAPGEHVALAVGADAAGSAVADDTGAIAGTATIPATAAAGAAHLVATGTASPSAAEASLTVTVATTTAVKVSGTAVYGKPVTLVATVAPTATGRVDFRDGSTALGSAQVSGSTATLTVTGLKAGRHSIVAVYRGDDSHRTSSSASLVVTVAKATPSSVTVSGAAFAKGTRPLIAVSVGTLPSGAYAVGTVTLSVAGKVVTTSHLYASAKGKLSVRLPAAYSTSIAVTATFTPTDTANIAAKTSATKTIAVKK